MNTQNKEILQKELNIDNYSYDKEYLKTFDFIMDNSLILPISLVKYADESINRLDNVKKIDTVINCYSVAEDIEKGIFEFALNYVVANGFPQHFFSMTYNDKLDNILINLDKNNNQIKNKTLINDILSSKLSGQIIAFLHMYQIHPARWKSIIDKNNLRDDTLSTVNTTDEFKCARCGERKHIYYITQTRCIDEPATVFYTCTVCRKTFTKSM
jgi:DNA-directed RNA polymerase subunit M/transcription elongation factor TFIIS